MTLKQIFTFEAGDITGYDLGEHTGLIQVNRPPNNHFDEPMILGITYAAQHLFAAGIRCAVLASEGKHFCAGANFSGGDAVNNAAVAPQSARSNPLYEAASQLIATPIPIVAAVQGAAIGGGLGVAVACDFRIGSSATRLAGNFVKLGIHPGFGLTHTLPRLIGTQQAKFMLMTGRRIKGEEAYKIGLLDELVAEGTEREKAIELAKEIATGAPLVLQSLRNSLNEGLSATVRKVTDIEFLEQRWQMLTDDHAEGLKSVAERRNGNFNNK